MLIQSPPAAATVCAMPVTLPDVALTQAEVEKLWARDRVALKRCFGSVQALRAYIEKLQSEFNGAAGGAK